MTIKVIGRWWIGLVRKDAGTEFRPWFHLVVAEAPEDVVVFEFAFVFARFSVVGGVALALDSAFARQVYVGILILCRNENLKKYLGVRVL